ncbi:MAG: sulfotransferase [Candidatus Hermodarchaeota archaeon]
MAEIIYISCVPRSGSTLLDNLLAAHQEIITVGEVFQLKAYALEDRRFYNPESPLVCSCGRRVADCNFWSQVEANLNKQLWELKLKPRFLEIQWQKERDIERKLWVKVGHCINRWPWLYCMPGLHEALQGGAIGKDSWQLFDAISSVTSARRIVDSSKSPFRFWSLHKARANQIKLIILCRDYRAVVHSMVRRGLGIRRSIEGWVRENRKIEMLSSDIPSQLIMRVRYEDLCNDSESVMRRLCLFLGLEFSPEVLMRPEHSNLHHLGGSPSKFDPKRRDIRSEDSYLEFFSNQELSLMRKIAGAVARDWGYE